MLTHFFMREILYFLNFKFICLSLQNRDLSLILVLTFYFLLRVLFITNLRIFINLKQNRGNRTPVTTTAEKSQ